MSKLRVIAIHVEEPEPDHYVWVLTERSGKDWEEVGRADAPTARYQHAMADGLLSLQAMVSDLDAGPRTPKAKAKRDRPAPPGEAAPAEPAAGATPRRAYFGFGPAR